MKVENCEFENINSFELKDIFECGQCFRWHKEEDNSYLGVTKAGVLKVKKEDNKIIINGYVDENVNFENFCKHYFDLEKDYDKIKSHLSKSDEVMEKAVNYGKGIRILNQDPWEMLISYIISAANNIPRISKCIYNISQRFGKKIVFEEKDFYMFPTPKELLEATMEDLRNCNLGFRDKYVYNATKLVFENIVDLEAIKNEDYKKAKNDLLKIEGVGSKVADCILLFSMQKSEAFPVDTWIKKIMNEVYIESKDVKKINEFAINKFGENAGIAQQYLFYYKKNEA